MLQRDNQRNSLGSSFHLAPIELKLPLNLKSLQELERTKYISYHRPPVRTWLLYMVILACQCSNGKY